MTEIFICPPRDCAGVLIDAARRYDTARAGAAQSPHPAVAGVCVRYRAAPGRVRRELAYHCRSAAARDRTIRENETMSEKPLVGLDVEDGIGVITIDNPPVNALGPGVSDGIIAAVEQA